MTRHAVGMLMLLGFAFAFALALDSRAALKVNAAAAEAKADSAAQVALDYQQRLEAIRSTEDALIVQFKNERDSALAQASRVSRIRQVVVERIIQVAGDSVAVVAAVEQLEAAHAAEVGELRGAIALGDSIIAAQARIIDAQQGANATLTRALSASRAEAQLWERAAKPGLFTKSNVITGGVLVIAATLVVLR
jgi:hypothetical protein